MKKYVFLVLLLLLFTGCSFKNVSVKDIKDYDINGLIDYALNSNISITNQSFNGYKYYLPDGVKIIGKQENNYKLLDNGLSYYLYVDLISYYHKVDCPYEIDSNKYLSKDINYNNKKGYVDITLKDNIYYINLFYNYGKIEVYCTENEIKNVLFNAIRILSSIEYNDPAIESMIGENVLGYSEEEFNLFESKREEGTFLDYIEEYDVYDEEKEEIDEDIIQSDF